MYMGEFEEGERREGMFYSGFRAVWFLTFSVLKAILFSSCVPDRAPTKKETPVEESRFMSAPHLCFVDLNILCVQI